MSTIIVGIIVFGGAGYVIYTNYLKKDRKSSCEACDCPAKPKRDMKQNKEQSSKAN